MQKPGEDYIVLMGVRRCTGLVYQLLFFCLE